MAFDVPDHFLLTSLALAARNGDFVSLKNLLSKGRRADIKDNRGWNALHEAAFSGACNCVELLLRKGKLSCCKYSSFFAVSKILHILRFNNL